MVAMSVPLVELLFVGRRFSSGDAQECASYFALFSVSLFLWSAQSIYARAFYAAGNTFVPMAAGTIVTLVSWPMYAALYHFQGSMGLALASDLGIALQTVTVAVLLDRRRMVPLASLDYREMGRCLLTGLVSGAAVWTAIWGLKQLPLPLLHAQAASIKRISDLGLLLVGCALWFVIAKGLLEKSGSALPGMATKRLGLR
jgi:putative peptidoglycan lipid II flippase